MDLIKNFKNVFTKLTTIQRCIHKNQIEAAKSNKYGGGENKGKPDIQAGVTEDEYFHNLNLKSLRRLREIYEKRQQMIEQYEKMGKTVEDYDAKRKEIEQKKKKSWWPFW